MNLLAARNLPQTSLCTHLLEAEFAHFTFAITLMQLSSTQLLAPQTLSILLRVALLSGF